MAQTFQQLEAEYVALRTRIARAERAETENERLRAALKAAEFGPTGRCPICFGWDGESEGDRRHSPHCSTAQALKE